MVLKYINFYLKVNIGDNKYVHLRVFEPLPYTGEAPSLENVEGQHKLEDPINFF
jgi:hypothetical protein